MQSDTKSLEDITNYVSINIKERLQSIPGVRLVDTYAGKKRAMRLRMDPLKLASYGLTPSDVQSANYSCSSARLAQTQIDNKSPHLKDRYRTNNYSTFPIN